MSQQTLSTYRVTKYDSDPPGTQRCVGISYTQMRENDHTHRQEEDLGGHQASENVSK